MYAYRKEHKSSTWPMARHFREGRGREEMVDRPCLPTGYPPARDFRLASLILGSADLAVISDKTDVIKILAKVIPLPRWVFFSPGF